MAVLRPRHNLAFLPQAGQRIIRREEYADWIAAQDQLRVASETARRLRQRAGREYRRQLALGVKAGREAERRRLLACNAELERRMQLFLQESEARMMTLLAAAVKSLTGKVPTANRLATAVAKILDEVSAADRPTITVNAGQRAAFCKELDRRGIRTTGLRIVADKELNPAMVRVEGGFGIIECDADAWLNSVTDSEAG